MLAPAAEALGVRLKVLAESPDVCATEVIPNAPVGDYTDLPTLREFARDVDVLTFDHEHVPTEHLRALVADGVVVRPGPEALVHAQDKLVMRRAVDRLGLPNPEWAEIRSAAELSAFGAATGWPVVIKTPRGGYDGKGVRVVGSVDEATDWLERAAGEPLLAEQRVPFTRELAVMVARSPMGQAASWPVVETTQIDGICRETTAPAPELDPDKAAAVTEAALKLAADLGVTGVMAMELFEVPSGRGFMINELAMRPHNTGHWTIDGAVTSQFEQHLRAVLDLPLGDPGTRGGFSVMANVLGGEYDDLYRPYLHVMARDPRLKVHMYGKSVRPGRKVGHVTVVGEQLDDLRARARHAADFFTGTITE
ncbi:5-(carboxyamino)imidazole ribonucleotide synthase [Spelaeicoccus albus]|uniref:N5-carboxyaminoimidazole ribonucleotide synthase n=2 Tax=Spelaeicoccus albus TaxID=1280376 RepID=A0A7Z0IHT8_9MICO|nr:5-(carboxyamino)imidazole ribonucleotide synthase [Spelaeicoccus albus]NYI67924.1 5-(carboxyamino)imidazole ribonucleotide synthase [Spelaeicoccus albus]